MFDSTVISYAIAFATALFAGLIATYVVRGVARRINFVDRPDGGRKNHTAPIALGGGVAVFVAMLAGVALSYAFARSRGVDILDVGKLGGYDRPVLLGLLQASVLTVLLGLIDDRFGLRGRYKLLGQIGIASLLVYSGVQITQFGFLNDVYKLGDLQWVGVAVTMVWILGTINAINLIDGIDGLASSVGMVLCLTVAAITGLHGHFAEAAIVLALAGALLGFLKFNFAPASIFLGDTGSMLIGLIVGVVAVHTSNKAPAAIAMAVPLAVWSVPILDSAAAILRRKLTGRSLFAADRGHLHHSLLTRGWSVRQAALFITLICATTCLSAVLSVLWKNELIALGIVGAVVVFLVFTKTFGHIEFSLMSGRVRESAASLSRSRTARPAARHRAVQLQGSREWNRLWAAMIEAADRHRLVKVKLSINIPQLHEVFYGSWESAHKPTGDAAEELWSLDHPLRIDGKKVGHIELTGQPDPQRASTPRHIIEVLEFLAPIENDVRHIREQINTQQGSHPAGRSLIGLKGVSGDLVPPPDTPLGAGSIEPAVADPASSATTGA